MNGNHTGRQQRAVSPVIGVILMVAITVLLAATAATFFLGFGPSSAQSRSPTAAFSFDYGAEGSGQTLDVSHASGDVIETKYLYVSVSGAACRDPSGPSANPNGQHSFRSLGVTKSDVAAGMTVTLDSGTLCNAGDQLVLESANVEVVWRTGSNSDSLIGWKGPAA